MKAIACWNKAAVNWKTPLLTFLHNVSSRRCVYSRCFIRASTQPSKHHKDTPMPLKHCKEWDLCKMILWRVLKIYSQFNAYILHINNVTLLDEFLSNPCRVSKTCTDFPKLKAHGQILFAKSKIRTKVETVKAWSKCLTELRASRSTKETGQADGKISSQNQRN